MEPVTSAHFLLTSHLRICELACRETATAVQYLHAELQDCQDMTMGPGEGCSASEYVHSELMKYCVFVAVMTCTCEVFPSTR